MVSNSTMQVLFDIIFQWFLIFDKKNHLKLSRVCECERVKQFSVQNYFTENIFVRVCFRIKHWNAFCKMVVTLKWSSRPDLQKTNLSMNGAALLSVKYLQVSAKLCKKDYSVEIANVYFSIMCLSSMNVSEPHFLSLAISDASIHCIWTSNSTKFVSLRWRASIKWYFSICLYR